MRRSALDNAAECAIGLLTLLQHSLRSPTGASELTPGGLPAECVAKLCQSVAVSLNMARWELDK